MHDEEDVLERIVGLVLALDFLLGVARIHALEDAQTPKVSKAQLQLLQSLGTRDVVHRVSGLALLLRQTSHVSPARDKRHTSFVSRSFFKKKRKKDFFSKLMSKLTSIFEFCFKRAQKSHPQACSLAQAQGSAPGRHTPRRASDATTLLPPRLTVRCVGRGTAILWLPAPEILQHKIKCTTQPQRVTWPTWVVQLGKHAHAT